MAQVAPAAALAAELRRTLATDPGLMAWMHEGQLRFGSYPNAVMYFDFAAERIIDSTQATSAPPPPLAPDVSSPRLDTLGGRKTGDYWIIAMDRRTTYPSGKAALIGGLLAIESVRPGTLETLENYKPRTKRVVARRPELLYDNPDQVAKFSAELMPGWFVATNNSLPEISKYLRQAANIAGLNWGTDFDFRFNR